MAVTHISKARKKLDECPGCGERFTRNDRVADHFKSCQPLRDAINAYLERGGA